MVSYTGWSADGAGVLANSLSGLGQQLGQAYQNNQKQQLLSQMGELAAQGKHAEAAKLAFASGHTDAGTELLKQAQTNSANTNLDAGLGSITGGVVANPSLPPVPGNSSDPRGIRNANPGNIIDSPFARSQPGYSGSDGRFARFDTIENGVNAQTKLLGAYASKGIDTVAGAVNRWAPKAENGASTDNYAAFVANKLGVDPNAKIDLSNPQTQRAMAYAMAEFENGKSIDQSKPVQVADASGRIVGGGNSSMATSQPPSGSRQGLENKRTALMNLMASSDYANAAPANQNKIKLMFEDTTRQLDRLDKVDEQAKQEPGYKLTAEMKAREQQVIAQGGDPKDPRNQHFINVGRYPKEDQSPLTATDKKAIMEADDAVNATKGVISSLQYAKQLSPKAMGFRGAGMLAEGGALVGNEASIATKELDNVVTSNTLSQLKTIFGGNPTEGEREILRQLEGSSSQPDAVRQKIYDRAIQMAETRMKFNQSRADELRGGTYYDSKKTEQPQTKLTPPTADDLTIARQKIKAGVPRERIIKFLEDNGHSAEGL